MFNEVGNTLSKAFKIPFCLSLIKYNPSPSSQPICLYNFSIKWTHDSVFSFATVHGKWINTIVSTNTDSK